MVLPGERLVQLIHQDSQDDMAASMAGSFDGEIPHELKAESHRAFCARC